MPEGAPEIPSACRSTGRSGFWTQTSPSLRCSVSRWQDGGSGDPAAPQCRGRRTFHLTACEGHVLLGPSLSQALTEGLLRATGHKGLAGLSCWHTFVLCLNRWDTDIRVSSVTSLDYSEAFHQEENPPAVVEQADFNPFYTSRASRRSPRRCPRGL